MRRHLTTLFTLLLLTTGHLAAGLDQRPRADVQPRPVITPVRPGAVTRLSLAVRLPKGVHVQADQPRDPALIATALSIEAPSGVTVERIVYPKASDLAQTGGGQPLAVFGSEFTIDVQLSLAPTVAAGALVIPAQLRYQACSETVCFAPTRAALAWTVNVTNE